VLRSKVPYSGAEYKKGNFAEGVFIYTTKSTYIYTKEMTNGIFALPKPI
jgi:hypothetical protein